MNSHLGFLLLAIHTAAALSAHAADQAHALQLAERKGCLECHAIGWALVGPAFTEIAARYRHDPGARERLVEKLRTGGSGHWGERFEMWPQTNLSDEEAYELVDWIRQLG